ncbi:hypothetical protein [Nocardioides bruguierae]|uniref:Uncharacterized protein n=1 Tax=Nocardioides bruguierae TaxID=2945102 RepID=A0A9X2DAX2_9ACTN|nr:hypothetical protein [Nocardioides bruguierae]MCL8027708.1 hypothetical protein [Nocardioides bruguierae]MCM0622575.1 hypothetical protein [Nocardioides bruguierae]
MTDPRAAPGPVPGPDPDLDVMELLMAWQVTLDRLELDVLRVESAVARGRMPELEPWRPEPHLGALPEPLRPRAEQLLHRQAQASARLTDRLHQVHREHTLADTVSRLSGRGVDPVYVDRAL